MKKDPAAILLIAILALLSTGVEIGDSLQPARILVIVALFWVVTRRTGVRLRSRCQTFLLAFGSVWLCWGLLSLLWTPDTPNGIREMTGVALGLVTAFSVMRLIVNTPAALGAIRTGWVWAFALTLPIAAWEVLFDEHLPSARGHDFTGGNTIISITYAATTFGNRNTYSAFVVVALPFVLWSLQNSIRWRKWLMALLVIAAVSIQVMNASRLGAGATLCELLAWLALKQRGKVRLRALLGGAILLVVLWQVLAYLPYTQLRYNLFLEGRDESVMGRTGLLECGLQFIAETAGAGVGAGGFADTMLSGRGAYDTRGAIDPHNVWIEVFAQYGILVGTAFVGWLLYCAWALMQARLIARSARQAAPELRQAGLYALVLLAAIPLNGMMNSGYITFTFLWTALGCVAGIVTMTEQARSARRRRLVIWKTAVSPAWARYPQLARKL